MELRTLADWTLRPRLLMVPGVARVNVFGGEVRQLQIQVRPAARCSRTGSRSATWWRRRAPRSAVRGAGFVETRRTSASSSTPPASDRTTRGARRGRDRARATARRCASPTWPTSRRRPLRASATRWCRAGPACCSRSRPVRRQHDGRDARARSGARRARAAARARGRDAPPAAAPAGELRRVGARQPAQRAARRRGARRRRAARVPPERARAAFVSLTAIPLSLLTRGDRPRARSASRSTR